MDSTETELWQAADRVFDDLLELPAAERQQRLAELQPEPGLRVKVLALLAAHESSHQLLEKPLFPAEVPQDSMAGRQLGGWRLLEEIGRGGSSVVYRAGRLAEGLEQQVAVKIFTLASLCNFGSERFRREAQILARLNHPNITALIDFGVERDGTYWLVMPLMRGERIDQWNEREKPDTRALVRRFLQVCEAVSYAHRALVIHRDLKPSNVFVDADGNVRLLDFGIGRFADDAEEYTGTFWRALTPGYAAPEQFSGGMSSTAMDVYGLGGLLYALLTGSPPGERSLQSRPEPVARASSTAKNGGETGRRHHRALRGDLDRVLAKALELEPQHRYSSVEALAEDLRRWLDGRPILARQPGLGYRIGKFIGRNKVGTGAAALLLLSLGAGVGATLWQAERASREAETAVAVKDFLIDLFEASDPAKNEGMEPSLEELLQLGVARIDTGLNRAPEVDAEMRLLLGNIHVMLGDYDQAQSLLESAQKIATDNNLDELVGDALCYKSTMLQEQGEPEKAIELLYQCREYYVDAGKLTVEREIQLLEDLYYAYANSGQKDEAARVLEQAITSPRIMNSENASKAYMLKAHHEEDPVRMAEILQEALEISKEQSLEIGELIALHSELALALLRTERQDEALRHRYKAFELAEKIFPAKHSRIAEGASSLGAQLLYAGRYSDAEPYLRRSLKIFEELDQQDTFRAIAAANNYGSLLSLVDRHGDALPYLQRTVDWLKGNFDPDDPNIGIALGNLAKAQAYTGNAKTATELWRKADAIFAKSDPGSRQINNTLIGIQIALLNNNRGAAQERWMQASSQLDKLKDPESPLHIYHAAYGARVKALTGEPAKVRKAFESALSRTETAPRPDFHWRLLETYGNYLQELGDTEAAETQWRAALKKLRELGQDQHPRIAELESKLSRG